MSKQKRPVPDLGLPLIETHCHLDYLKAAPTEEIIATARAVGVERFVTIAVEPANFDAVRTLAHSYPEVWGTQGVHPHEASKFDADADARIVASAADERIVAVGEIGLDYHYDHSPRAVQRAAFARQLEIAADSDRPVVIHTREAEDDTRAILAEHGPAVRRRGVIHSFTSSPALAEFCLDQGFLLGFNGIVTFNAADNVREVVALTPVERLLIETDSPFLTPVPYRGRENAPGFIPFVAEKIAAVKAVPIDALLRQLHTNSIGLFWPGELAREGASTGERLAS
ncbi:MAG: TatD family hydrolase [Pseudomonadota bacterium]